MSSITYVMVNAVLFFIFVLLQFGDLWTTNQDLERKKGKEANPIMAKLMSLLGFLPALIVTKVAIIAFLATSAILTGSYAQLSFGLMLIVMNGIYAHVVINNYDILKKRQSSN